jgi:hypothetical protein
MLCLVTHYDMLFVWCTKPNLGATSPIGSRPDAKPQPFEKPYNKIVTNRTNLKANTLTFLREAFVGSSFLLIYRNRTYAKSALTGVKRDCIIVIRCQL